MNGRIWDGANGFAGEAGHMIVGDAKGLRCGCGGGGCLEQYASATGIVRMAPGPYSIMTIVGSAAWCAVLAVFGQKVLGDQPDLMQNPDALMHALKEKSHIVAAAVLVVAVLYFVVIRVTRKPAPATTP